MAYRLHAAHALYLSVNFLLYSKLMKFSVKASQMELKTNILICMTVYAVTNTRNRIADDSLVGHQFESLPYSVDTGDLLSNPLSSDECGDWTAV